MMQTAPNTITTFYRIIMESLSQFLLPSLHHWLRFRAVFGLRNTIASFAMEISKTVKSWIRVADVTLVGLLVRLRVPAFSSLFFG
jgi:hypothetical protein